MLASCPATPPPAAPRNDRPRYELRVRVEPGFRVVRGRLRVRFSANRPTERLVFRLWPNGPIQRTAGQRLDTGAVTEEGRRLPISRPDPTTLVVRRHLARGESTTVSLAWRLRVPANSGDRVARFAGGLRLGTFFPILAWDPARGWVTDPPAQVLAESATSPTADFDVRVRAPRGTKVLVSGEPAGPGRWRAQAVRDIGLAAGRFRVFTTSARAPRPVTIRVAIDPAAAVAKEVVVPMARSTLERLSRLYGAYPWRTYTIVFPRDLAEEGIEYPTLSFVGDVFTAQIVFHETAHQWFYSLVGNDQWRDPWLDEALATWGQARVAGSFSSAFPVARARHVGAPMGYWLGRQRQYFSEVYAGGALALRSLGPTRKVDCALRVYAARNAYRLASPANLLDALNAVFPGAERRLRRFGIHRH